MKPPCEIVVKEILPSIRRELVLELHKRGYNQVTIANLLGLTKSAVNQYIKNIRGTKYKGNFKNSIKQMADQIEKQDKKDQLINSFCNLCSNLKRCKK